jgi:hypothetical protein
LSPDTAIFADPGFVRRYPLEALAMIGSSTRAGNVTLRMHEEDVAEYRCGDVAVVAKAYTDAALADHTWAVLRTLAEGQFGTGSPYRVPQRLLRMPDGNILFMAAASGKPLSSNTDAASFISGCRWAGEWLARLHADVARIGTPVGSEEILARLDKQMAAAQERGVPTATYRDTQARIAHDLALADGGECVQTHGRFHPGHAFIGRGSITMIDLDRSHPCNPAVDSATFLYRLRMMRLKGTINSDGLLADAESGFLKGYGSLPPNVNVYLAAAWFRALLRTLGKRRADSDTRMRRLRYYETRLHRSGYLRGLSKEALT